MTRKAHMVECVGSSALISHWQIVDSSSRSLARLGHWRGSVLGNDAVIVARQLKDLGLSSMCRLLDPTSADLKYVSSALSPFSVVAVGGNRGIRTRSLCLEDTDGKRSWIFSRLPSPQGEIGEIAAEILYIDYYPEFADYLNQHLVGIEDRVPLVIVNLSAITPTEEVPHLEIRPVVVQASVLGTVSLDEAVALAKRLIEKTGAAKAFVTMGVRGAVLATGEEAWYAAVDSRGTKNIMGSGAIFSSEVIGGLSRGLDRKELLDSAVARTTGLLEALTR